MVVIRRLLLLEEGHEGHDRLLSVQLLEGFGLNTKGPNALEQDNDEVAEPFERSLAGELIGQRQRDERIEDAKTNVFNSHALLHQGVGLREVCEDVTKLLEPLPGTVQYLLTKRGAMG